MLTFFAGLKAKAWGIIAAIGVGLGLLLTAFLKGRKSAQNEMNAETVDTVLDVTKKVRDNEKDTHTGGSAVGRLRKNYSRD